MQPGLRKAGIQLDAERGSIGSPIFRRGHAKVTFLSGSTLLPELTGENSGFSQPVGERDIALFSRICSWGSILEDLD